MHVAVGLFNNRSQKRSEYSRNISDTLGCINPICDLLLDQQIVIWNLFFNFIQFVTPHEHFVVSKKSTFFQKRAFLAVTITFVLVMTFKLKK